MPIDFSILLSCYGVDTFNVFCSIESELFKYGFWRKREVLVSLGQQEIEIEEEVTIVSLAKEEQFLRNWDSLYMEFLCTEFLIGVQISIIREEYSSIIISIDRKQFHRLHRDKIPYDLYHALAIIARSSDACGGTGGVSIPLDPIPPDHILSEILSAPENRDLWPTLLVVPAKRATDQAVKVWAEFFECIEFYGFLFFIDREYLELCHTAFV